MNKDWGKSKWHDTFLSSLLIHKHSFVFSLKTLSKRDKATNPNANSMNLKGLQKEIYWLDEFWQSFGTSPKEKFKYGTLIVLFESVIKRQEAGWNILTAIVIKLAFLQKFYEFRIWFNTCLRLGGSFFEKKLFDDEKIPFIERIKLYFWFSAEGRVEYLRLIRGKLSLKVASKLVSIHFEMASFQFDIILPGKKDPTKTPLKPRVPLQKFNLLIQFLLTITVHISKTELGVL